MLTRRRLALLAVALAALRLPAQDGADLQARVQAAVDAAREAAGIPGMGAAVRTADGTIVAVGSGVADIENDVVVTPATVFRLASISKCFTAVAALRLSEQGVLDLDRDVSELVKEFPKKDEPVTTRQLLGHLGGIRHYAPGEIESSEHFTRVADALAVFAKDPLIAPPGTKHSYSTYGFNLAGAAMATAADKSFADILRDEVFVPAGCTTLRVDDPRVLVPHRAQGYFREGTELRNSIPVDITNKVPGGGLCGTPTDLVHFAGALLEGYLLSPQSLELAWTTQHQKDGKATGYGYGFGVARVDGHRVVSHSGGQPRVSTLLWIDRDARIAVALMANLEGQARPLRELAVQLCASSR
ncbi:MAG: serine hydrolase domain-containing protein [Planctomycetota bacterium]